MQSLNAFEKKYKQLSLLGKGNYGICGLIQVRSTKCVSTMASKANRRPTSWLRRCSWRVCPSRTSKLPMDRYVWGEVD